MNVIILDRRSRHSSLHTAMLRMQILPLPRYERVQQERHGSGIIFNRPYCIPV